MINWLHGVTLAFKGSEMTRGLWSVFMAGAIALSCSVLVGVALLSDPPEPVLAGLLAVFVVMAVPIMADHVDVTETEVLNCRSMPIGSSRTDRERIKAVGWTHQPMGFAAPVLILDDEDFVVLTALGQQAFGGPSHQAENLATKLSVPYIGQVAKKRPQRRTGRGHRRHRRTNPS